MKKTIAFALSIMLAVVLFTAFKYGDVNEGSHEIDPKVKGEVLKVLDEYMSTFNARDAKGWQATYHFPHFRLASGKMSVLEKEGQLDSAKTFSRLQQTGWHYSKWDHRNIIQASDTKVHVDTRFSRYRKDGSLIGTYESLYILTKEAGKWGVKMRSSYAE